MLEKIFSKKLSFKIFTGFLFVSSLFLFTSQAKADGNITACGTTLAAPGIYTLTTSISTTTANCITITSTGVTITDAGNSRYVNGPIVASSTISGTDGFSFTVASSTTIYGNINDLGAGSGGLGTVTFSGTANNSGTLTGNAIFSGTGSYNAGVINGAATFSGTNSYNSGGSFAYVVNANSNTLQKFNATTMTQVGSNATTGSYPESVKFSPSGLFAYVVNNTSNTLQKFSTVTMTQVGSNATTGSSPSSVAVSSDGLYAYVVNQTSNTLQKFSTATMTKVGSDVAIGSSPWYVTISTDGSFVYVVAQGNTLQKFNATTMTQVGSNATTGSSPRSVAVSSDGLYAYVANWSSYTLQKFSTVTMTQVGSDVPTGATPRVSISSDGLYAYVVNQTGNTLQKFSTVTMTQVGSNATTGSAPQSLSVSSDGQYVYVANFGSNTLQKFSTATMTQVGSNAATGNQPFSVNVSPVATITGTTTFSGTGSYNGGTLTGTTTFSGNAYNSGTITGNPTFNASSTNSGVVTGNPTFAGTASSSSTGLITGNPTFNASSSNAGTITGNATFNGTASSTNTGTITGNSTFNGTAYSSDPTGTVTGTITFPNPVVFTLAGTNQVWSANTSSWVFTGGASWVFSGTGSYNQGYLNGQATFSGTNSYNAPLFSNGYLYVVNSSSNTLQKFSTATMTQVGSNVTTGSEPWQVTISPDGLYAYVTNKISGTLQKFSTATMTQVGSDVSTGGSSPRHFALSSDGLYIYVSNQDSASVQKFSTVTMTQIGSGISVPGYPSTIAVSPDGLYAYVVSDGNNILRKINTSTMTQVGSDASTGGNPSSVVISSDGTYAYVTSTNNNLLQKFSTATMTQVGSDVPTGNNPQSSAISPDGSYVYVVNYYSSTLQKFRTSDMTQVGNNATTGVYPYSVAVSSDGAYAYVVNSNSNTLQKFSTSDMTQVGSDVTTGSQPFFVTLPSNQISNIIGTTTFSGTGSYNRGLLTGTTTFGGNAYNSGTIVGSPTFNASSTNTGTITGNPTFSGVASTTGTSLITGNAIFNASSSNTGTITGNPTFNNSSYNTGTINGTPTYNGLTGWVASVSKYFIGGEMTTLDSTGKGAWGPKINGLSTYWPLNDTSGSFADYSGNGNNGTANGNIVYNSTGAVFDGNNSYVDNTSSTNLSTGANQSWTISAWIKPASYTNDSFVAGFGSCDGSNGTERSIYMINNHIYFWGSNADVDWGVPWDIGSWQHVVIESDGSNLVLYKNNQKYSTSLPSGFNSTGSTIQIGGGCTKGYFNGQISNFSVWNRSLSDSEVSQAYNDTPGMPGANYSYYLSGQKTTLDLNGNGFYNGAYYQAGVLISGITLSGSTVTVDGANFPGTYGTATTTWIFQNGATNIGTITGNNVTFSDVSTNAGYITGNPTFNASSSNTGTITGNPTFNNSSYNIGTINGTPTYNGLTGWSTVANKYFIGGEMTTLDSNGNGAWGEISIPTNALLAFWPLDETSGTRYDVSGNGHDLNILGSVSSVSGVVGNASYSSGNGSLGSGYDFTLRNLQNYSVFTWFKAQPGVSSAIISDWADGWGLYTSAGYGFTGNPGINFWTTQTSNGTPTVFTSTDLKDGNWHQIGLVKNGSQFSLYVDGLLNQTVSVTPNPPFPGDVFNLMGTYDGNDRGNVAVDQTGVWSRALSDSEISSLYNYNSNYSYYLSGQKTTLDLNGNGFYNGAYYQAGVLISGITLSGSTVTVDGANFPGTYGTATTTWIFQNGATNIGTITGNNVTFSDVSTNAGYITGNANLSASSTNTGVITGNATFNGTAYSLDPVGTVTGTVTFPNPVTFNISNTDQIWSANTSSWTFTGGASWVFSGNGSFNAGTIGNSIFSGTGSYNLGTITNDASFANNSYNRGHILGDATFLYLTSNIRGEVTDVTSYANGDVKGITKDSLGSTIKTWIFDTTNNLGTVTGDAIFSGDNTFNDSAYAYVVDATNALQKFRTSDMTQVGSNAITGGYPYSVVLSSDGQYAYVVNQQGNTLQKFRTSDMTQVGSDATTGSSPRSVSLSPDGQYAYVVNGGGNTLQKFRTSDMTQVGSDVPTGNNPQSSAISPDGSYVYVVNYYSSTLQKFRTSDMTQVGNNATTGVYPYSVAVSSDGAYAYVVNSNSNTLQKFSTSDMTQVGNNATTGIGPQFVTLSSDGQYAYVVSVNSNTLQKFNTTTMIQVGSDAITGTWPQSVALSSDGTYAYVVNENSNTLQKFRTSDMTQVGSNATTGVTPYSLTLSPVSLVTGNATFSGASSTNNGTVLGTAIFFSNSINNGTVGNEVTISAPSGKIFRNGTGDGLWSTPGNWDGGVLPVDGDNIILTAPITLQNDVTNNIYVVTSGITIDGNNHIITGDITGKGLNFNITNSTVTGNVISNGIIGTTNVQTTTAPDPSGFNFTPNLPNSGSFNSPQEYKIHPYNLAGDNMKVFSTTTQDITATFGTTTDAIGTTTDNGSYASVGNGYYNSPQTYNIYAYRHSTDGNNYLIGSEPTSITVGDGVTDSVGDISSGNGSADSSNGGGYNNTSINYTVYAYKYATDGSGSRILSQPTYITVDGTTPTTNSVGDPTDNGSFADLGNGTYQNASISYSVYAYTNAGDGSGTIISSNPANITVTQETPNGLGHYPTFGSYLSWSDVGATGYFVVDNTAGTYIDVGGATAFEDDGSGASGSNGWTSGSPSYSYTGSYQYYPNFQSQLSWDAASGADGYIVFDQNSYYFADIGNNRSFTDSDGSYFYNYGNWGDPTWGWYFNYYWGSYTYYPSFASILNWTPVPDAEGYYVFDTNTYQYADAGNSTSFGDSNNGELSNWGDPSGNFNYTGSYTSGNVSYNLGWDDVGASGYVVENVTSGKYFDAGNTTSTTDDGGFSGWLDGTAPFAQIGGVFSPHFFSLGGKSFDGSFGGNIGITNSTISGSVTSDGGDSAYGNASHAGSIIVSNSTISNPISAKGGSTAVGAGGAGGSITVSTSTTSTMTASGGNGTTAGGNGGDVTINVSNGILSTASVVSNGGNATGCGDGGNGGLITLSWDSTNYVATSNAGSASNTSCPPSTPTHTGGHVNPPVVTSRPAPSAPTAAPTSHPSSTVTPAVYNPLVTSISLPVQQLKPLNLQTLPAFGTTEAKGSFSFIAPITNFLFAPLPSVLTAPSPLKTFLDQNNVIGAQDLVGLKTKPIPLSLPSSLGLFSISTTDLSISNPFAKNVAPTTSTLKTTLTSDAKYNLLQLVSVLPQTKLIVTLKDAKTATFNGAPVTFTNGVATLTIPKKTGRYYLVTSSSPVPLAVDVKSAKALTAPAVTVPVSTNPIINIVNKITDWFSGWFK